MDNIVLNFSNKLQKFSEKLGEVADVEWRLSREPVPYLEAVEIMEARVAAIADGKTSELIWFLEHPSLYTAGTSAKATDLIDAARFPVYATGRGGQYTYHGPGQLVAYVMFDLNKRGRDVRRFVTALENWVIGALDSYGIRGERREGRPGIWVAGPEFAGQHDEKIAALGVRVRRWITFHGVAINVCPNLSHFSGIVPCGISEAGVTSVAAQLHKMGKAVDADLA